MSNETIIAEMDKDCTLCRWDYENLVIALDKARAEGKEDFINSDCNLKKVMLEMKEAGRQSAQKEIDDLKAELHMTQIDRNNLAKMIVVQKAEHQEQVRKLKEKIEDDIADLDNCMSPDGHMICEPLSDFKKGKIESLEKIKSELFKYFPDCAEQPIQKKENCKYVGMYPNCGECDYKKKCAEQPCRHKGDNITSHCSDDCNNCIGKKPSDQTEQPKVFIDGKPLTDIKQYEDFIKKPKTEPKK